VIHFDLRLAALDVAAATWWVSAPGYEGVTVRHEDVGRPYVEVLIGPDPDRLDDASAITDAFMSDRESRGDAPTPTTVGGRPATLTRYEGLGGTSNPALKWEPVDGLFARIQGFQTDRSALFEAAAALRLDVAQRCAVALRIAAPPPGGTLTACDTAVRTAPHPTRGVWIHSLLTYRTPSGGDVGIWAEEDRPRANLDTSQFRPNATVGGRPAQWRTADPRGLWILGFGRAGELFISGASKAESIRVAAGVSVVGNLADPSTWPAVPVG
jgi:hypothetical protein